jgi:hypothetical protein
MCLAIAFTVKLTELSNDKEYQKQAIDTAAAYGKTAITHLLDLNNRLGDDEIRHYIMSKIHEIKTKNP